MTFNPNISTIMADGPSADPDQPSKPLLRQWGTNVEAICEAFTTNGGLIFATKALMVAQAATYSEPRSAWVYADSTPANNGIYVLNPTTDTWTRVGRLPYDFVIGTDTGAGTANAIQITTDIPVADGMIVAFSLFEATTMSPVTVSINGGTALTLKTNRGSNASALTADMEIWGRVRSSDNTLRLLNDQDVSALVAQAEATLSEFETHYLGAYTTAGQPTLDNEGNALAIGAIYWNSTESEMRIWDGATWLAFSGGIADGSITDAKIATSSAVKNRSIETISPFDPTYGALGGTTDDQVAIQAAWDAGAASTALVRMALPMRAGGQLTTDDNLHVKWNNGAWTRQTAPSLTGSFIQTLRANSTDAASIQNNILLENPQIDGSLFPAPISLEVASSTATSVTFTAAASAVDDFYVGLLLQDMGGGNEGGLRIVTDYVGATRIATHTTAWVSNPTAGAILYAGWNDNAIGAAAGLTNLNAVGGILKNYPANLQVPAATGGKGINYEQGVSYSRQKGIHVEDCGTGFFVQGVDGVFTNGAKRRASGILLSDLSTRNCGSALTIAGVNASADPDGDSDDSMIVVNGLTYENAGHNPWRIIPSDHQKSGIINFLEAQNVSVSNVRGRNDATYPNTSPGYPTDFAARCGYGLSGNIGAMVWGWGRNLKINGFVHSGNVDNVIVVRRGRALGDDAGGGVPGAPQNCFNWDFRGIEHHGIINEYVIRIDPTAGFRVANNELSGNIEVSVNGLFVTGGLVDPNMSGFTALTMTIRDHVNAKTIIGTPAQIYAAGNTFASFGAGTTDLRVKNLQNAAIQGIKYTLADDAAVSVTPPKAHGIVSVTSATSLLNVLIAFRTTGGAQCVCIGTEPASFTALNTGGTLTGTTGIDTEFTVRCDATNNLVYFENRRGASVDFYVTFIG